MSLNEITLFIEKLKKSSNKNDIAFVLLNTLSLILRVKFLSFVEKTDNELKIVCQSGDPLQVQRVQEMFNKGMSRQIYDFVIQKKQYASLKLGEKEQFIFIPLYDEDTKRKIEHGVVVCHLTDNYAMDKDTHLAVNILIKIASMSMTKMLENSSVNSYAKLQSQIKSELKLANNIQKSMSKNLEAKKMLFSILEDEDALFNGNLWWLQDLNPDMILVLMAKVITSGVPAAMVSGYVLGEMNGLKNKAEISLRPSEVLRHLNWGLNDIFKNTGVTVNAWYGVFNAGARKVCFSNANHPDPFLIGPEQQVSNLIIEGNKKGESLGVNLNSVYRETSSFIPVGSRLVICTQNLLEQAAKVGERYDQTWFPQILETLGTLSLSEMRTTLENILSENKNGTSVKPSRLALLLEMPS